MGPKTESQLEEMQPIQAAGERSMFSSRTLDIMTLRRKNKFDPFNIVLLDFVTHLGDTLYLL